MDSNASPGGIKTPRNATLERTTFTVSRLMEYFSVPELTKQIGHPLHLWPIAILKELIDNALDAAEKKKVAPRVRVKIYEDSFSVRDNGPGMPESVIRGSIDYLNRVSDNIFRVCPTRGQQGNGLKTVWAAPFVAGGNVEGKVEVAAHGTLTRLSVRVNQIAQQPVIDPRTEPSKVKNGTFVRVW